MGYDTDSRKAESTYREIIAQTQRLITFLGEDFDTFAYDLERL